MFAWFQKRSQRTTARERLAYSRLSGDTNDRTTATLGVPDDNVGRWLFLAGRREPDATARFWTKTLCATW